MPAASNRTFICSVVFLDIVGYSKKPVVEQIQLKERLNAALTESLANVAVNDRIILDTGDGAALSFLGDPEDALFVSLSIRDSLAAPSHQGGPDLPLRLGVNLGPVRLVKDINDQPNIIGDGINVAQRVMSFAHPGQILVSRSFFEVVSCMSEDYRKLFHYEGSRTDKHVREHEVYAVEAGDNALKLVTAATPARKSASGHGPAVIDSLSRGATAVTSHLRRKPWLATTLAVVAILALAVSLRLTRQPSVAPLAAPAPPPSKVAAAPPAQPVQKPPEPKAEKLDSAKPKPAAPVATPAPAKKAAEPVRAPEAKPRPPVVAQAREPAAAAPAAKTDPRSPVQAGSGVILLTIRPWGEIYVDGVHWGDTPPLYELRVAAGRHRLEIRNPEFETHVRNLDVVAGARTEVRHVFLPKEQPNPFRRSK